METTYESRPAIQRYLAALESRLKPKTDPQAEAPVEPNPADEALADAREFLLSEWEALREAAAEPADDLALYDHFVAKFGTPEEVAAGYGLSTLPRHAPRTEVLPKSSQPDSNEPKPNERGPNKLDRGYLPNALVLAGAAVVAACVVMLMLWNRAPDGPTVVPAVEPAAPAPLGELRTSWAERVVSFRFGLDEPRDAQAAATALGPADCRRPDVDPPTCVSLGDGGELVVEFTTNVIVDGPGADLAIHEVGYFEPVRVAASENGTDWFELGVSDQRLATFDLAKAGLARARFVRVTDARTGRTNDLNSPGAEIDSVAALNSVAAVRE